MKTCQYSKTLPPGSWELWWEWSYKIFVVFSHPRWHLSRCGREVWQQSQKSLHMWRPRCKNQIYWGKNQRIPVWLKGIIDKVETFQDTVSATATVKVSIGVLQQLFAVNMYTVYVIPGIAHITLDPLHRVLLGQPALWCRAWLHYPNHYFLHIFLVWRWGRGRAGWGGGRGGGGGGWGGWRGQGWPGRDRVFSRATSSLTGREERKNQTFISQSVFPNNI